MNFLSVSFFHFFFILSPSLSLIYLFYLYKLEFVDSFRTVPFNGNSWDFVGLCFWKRVSSYAARNIRGISRDNFFIYYAY